VVRAREGSVGNLRADRDLHCRLRPVSRTHTGFHRRIEDQGYLLPRCNCPTEHRARPRTSACSDFRQRNGWQAAGSREVISIAGIHIRPESSSSPPTRAVAYLIPQWSWGARAVPA